MSLSTKGNPCGHLWFPQPYLILPKLIFAEQKLLLRHYGTNTSNIYATNVDKTLYSPTTQQSYSTKATLENFNKRGAKQVHCIANCVLN